MAFQRCTAWISSWTDKTSIRRMTPFETVLRPNLQKAQEAPNRDQNARAAFLYANGQTDGAYSGQASRRSTERAAADVTLRRPSPAL